jgi:hypothetical protein
MHDDEGQVNAWDDGRGCTSTTRTGTGWRSSPALMAAAAPRPSTCIRWSPPRDRARRRACLPAEHPLTERGNGLTTMRVRRDGSQEIARGIAGLGAAGHLHRPLARVSWVSSSPISSARIDLALRERCGRPGFSAGGVPEASDTGRIDQAHTDTGPATGFTVCDPPVAANQLRTVAVNRLFTTGSLSSSMLVFPASWMAGQGAQVHAHSCPRRHGAGLQWTVRRCGGLIPARSSGVLTSATVTGVPVSETASRQASRTLRSRTPLVPCLRSGPRHLRPGGSDGTVLGTSADCRVRGPARLRRRRSRYR